MADFHPAAALVGRFYAERNREYPLAGPDLSVGRSPESTLRIPDPRVAPTHVRIQRRRGIYSVETVALDVPTRLNGFALPVGARRPLTHGDVLALSELEFEFLEATGARTRLRVLEGVHRGKVFRVDHHRVAVGRALDNDIQFPDRSVSRHHCRLWNDGEVWLIEDLGSTNGTLINGDFLRTPRTLRDGDEILTGFSRFLFRTGDAAAGTWSEATCA